MNRKRISTQALQRLTLYHNYLKTVQTGMVNISAPMIASAMGLNEVVVRKDLACVSANGKPKIGYVIKDLIGDIEMFLGYGNANTAIIAGAGNLGRALMAYDGFGEYGLNIAAAFDSDEKIVGTEVKGKKIYPIGRMKEKCAEMKVKIGIIAVPASAAQRVCDLMADAGITAILNFAPVHLTVPDSILVRNEDMAYSLAMLSRHVEEKANETV